MCNTAQSLALCTPAAPSSPEPPCTAPAWPHAAHRSACVRRRRCRRGAQQTRLRARCALLHAHQTGIRYLCEKSGTLSSAESNTVPCMPCVPHTLCGTVPVRYCACTCAFQHWVALGCIAQVAFRAGPGCAVLRRAVRVRGTQQLERIMAVRLDGGVVDIAGLDSFIARSIHLPVLVSAAKCRWVQYTTVPTHACACTRHVRAHTVCSDTRHTHIHAHMHVHIHTYTFERMYARAHMHAHIFVRASACMPACMTVRVQGPATHLPVGAL